MSKLVPSSLAWLLTVVVSTATVTGCDDGADHPQPEYDAGKQDRDAGKDGDGAAPAPADDAGEDAGADGGDPGGDGATDAGLPAPDDTEVTPEQLIAGKEGRVWTYAVTQQGTGTACPASTITRTASRVYEEQGARFIEFTGDCGEGYLNRFRGQDVEQQFGSDWHLSFDAPVREGARFMSIPPYVFEWRFAGSVTVAAGTFTNCWTRHGLDGPGQDNTYCPGIGKVRSESPGRFNLELTAVTP